MNNILKSIYPIIFASLLPAVCHSGEMGDSEKGLKSKLPNVYMLSLNDSRAKVKQSSNIELSPNTTNFYYAESQKVSIFGGELFVGYEKRVNEWVAIQFGAEGALTNDARLRGIIVQNQDPDSLYYFYKIYHGYVGAKGRLVAHKEKVLQPYISGSLGAGFNNSHGFINKSNNPAVPTTANFASNLTTAISYIVGGGVEARLDDNIKIGVGYEYSGWGKSKLGIIPGQTTNSGPGLANIYTNSLQISIIYKAVSKKQASDK